MYCELGANKSSRKYSDEPDCSLVFLDPKLFNKKKKKKYERKFTKKDDLSLSFKVDVQIFERIYILLILNYLYKAHSFQPIRKIAQRFPLTIEETTLLNTDVLNVMNSKYLQYFD